MVILSPDYDQKLLRKIKSSKMPVKVLYFDTETDDKIAGKYTEHVFKLGWTCFCNYDAEGNTVLEEWNEWHSSNMLANFIDQCASLEKPLYIFAHNIFFDLQCIEFFRRFTKKGYALGFYYDKGMTYILSIRKKRNNIWLLSTTNYFDTRLENVGKFVGLPKLDIDFEESTESELSIYCRRDVEIIKKAMEFYYKFIIKHDLGKFSLTRASQAFSSYCYRFMYRKIYIHSDETVQKLERDAYMGGRVECFRLGEIKGSDFVLLDYNSMFPYVMKIMDVPVKLINYRIEPDLRLVNDILKTFCVVAEVDVKTDVPIYALRNDGKTIFPVGDFRCFLCTEGLKEALLRGHVKKVIRLAVYQKDKIFSEYVDFFYGLKRKYKQEKNDIMVKMTKIFLNSLYGKFAQKCPVQIIEQDYTFEGFYRMETYDLVSHEFEVEYKMFNTKVIERGWVEGDRSFVAISAHITEAARLLLWQLIERVGIDRVLYCDTDSIILHTHNLSRITDLMDDSNLGYLRIDETFKSLTILGLKSYITDTKRVLKGIPKRAVEIEPYLFEYRCFLSQLEHMKKSIEEGVWSYMATRLVQEYYDKGVVNTEGKISPFHISGQTLVSETPQLPF